MSDSQITLDTNIAATENEIEINIDNEIETNIENENENIMNNDSVVNTENEPNIAN